jgi:hypothetical protein
MAVITGGNIIRNGARQIEGSKPRLLPWSGVPVGATTYAGLVAVGDLVVDVATGNIYEYTEPAGVPTYTRRDTV